MTEALASSRHIPVWSVGYDFFANFTVVGDRHGGTMTFIKN